MYLISYNTINTVITTHLFDLSNATTELHMYVFINVAHKAISCF